MLSSFLPPVPSLPNDPPEHFPLRKTGEWNRQVGPRRGVQGAGPRMWVRSVEEREGLAGQRQPMALFSLTLPSLALTQR